MAKLNPDEEFHLLQKLLEKHQKDNPLVKECLEKTQTGFTLLNSTGKKGDSSKLENVVATYELKAALEGNRPENAGSDYPGLINAIKNSGTDHIKISNFTTEEALYSIFSDFELNKFIGILKSGSGLKNFKDKLKPL